MAIAEDNLTSTAPPAPLAAPIRRLLDTVRQRIRRYLWAEGLAAIVAFLLAAFWLTLVFDWFFEPPVLVRVALLVIVGGGAGWVGFHLLFDRLRVALTDRSLALLLERKFPLLGDSLLTAVEFAAPDSAATPSERQMVSAAAAEALTRVDDLDLDQLFNPAPLVRNVLAAVALGISALGFALFDAEAVETWARRVLTFSNDPWPRKTRLVIEGFEGGSIKVARGSDVELTVKADTAMRVPQSVRVQYRSAEGLRGRATMVQRGKAVPGRDPYQSFTHSFQGILAPLTFDVIGGDDRHRGLRIEVVDSPTVTGLTLHCEYPAYMRREPRDIAVTGAMQIPRGTKVRVQFTTNKPMTELTIADGSSAPDPAGDQQASKATAIRPAAGESPREFTYDLGMLTADRTLLISLLDTDNIRNREPNRLTIGAVADEVPQLEVRLRGIGSAITPQAQLPIIGAMKDDYGIARTWFEFAVEGQEPVVQDLARAPRATTELPVDEAFDVRLRGLNPGQKATLTLKAQDTFELPELTGAGGKSSAPAGPQTGASSPFQLDIVTGEELRSLLEARELNLRRRFEQLLGEVAESRDSLARLRPRPTPAPGEAGAVAPPAEADDAAEAPDDAPASPEVLAERALVRDRLRVEQILQNSRKNADETLGVAVAFDDIHDELVNNRVDTEELKSRLKQGIADPLRQLATAGFSQLEQRLTELQQGLPDAQARETTLAASEAQLDAMLSEMQLVLSKMLELETFNEVVDLLRSIIDSQEGLNEKTKDSRKAKLRELLE
ncbi:MAG: hypothetical protein JNG90_04775 [Planctomycetaceae bacterium]|nr:hypothetical protein [Planctomycetaceae bacterium]